MLIHLNINIFCRNDEKNQLAQVKSTIFVTQVVVAYPASIEREIYDIGNNIRAILHRRTDGPFIIKKALLSTCLENFQKVLLPESTSLTHNKNRLTRHLKVLNQTDNQPLYHIILYIET